MKKNLKSRLIAFILAVLMASSSLMAIPASATGTEPPNSVSSSNFAQNDFEESEELPPLTQEQIEALHGLRNLEGGLIGFDGEYALEDDDRPVDIIVVFNSAPAGVVALQSQAVGLAMPEATAQRIAESDHDLFRQELAELFSVGGIAPRVANYSIRIEYRRSLNGVAMTMPANMVMQLLDFNSVAMVFPDETVALDPIDIDLLGEIIAEEIENRNPPGGRAGRAKMNADRMHEMGYRGEGVLVAVLDTGIDYNHPAFQGAFLTMEEWNERAEWSGAVPVEEHQLINGYFKGRNQFGVYSEGLAHRGEWDPMETYWVDNIAQRGMHGTHVAGSILARDSGGPVAALGVAPEAHMIAYRILGGAGQGVISEIIVSFEDVYYDRPDVVNMSIGLGANSPLAPASLAITNLALQFPSMVFINSAGNSGDQGLATTSAPAGSSKAITVSAMSHNEGALSTINMGSFSASGFSGVVDYAGSDWQRLENGRYVSSRMNHNDGEIRIFALPNMGAPAGDDRDTLGVGIAADFAMLVEQHGAEALQGAFVLARRGDVNSLIDNMRTFGMAGAVSVSAPGQGVHAWQGMQINHRTVLNINFETGMELYRAMTDRQGVMNISERVDLSHDSWLAWFSSRGPIGTSFEIKPEIGAHGEHVLSPIPPAWHPFLHEMNPEDAYPIAYANASGTSMSTPHLAGAVALMIQYSRDNELGTGDMGTGQQWTMEEIRTRMMNTAIPIGHGVNSVFEVGAGYVDIYAAVTTDTVVYVEFDRVATDAAFTEDLTETTRTGAFSFGGQNMLGREEAFSNTLAAFIANYSNTDRTYTLSHRWTPTSVNNVLGGIIIQEPGDYATLTMPTQISVPAGQEAEFNVTFEIQPGAPFQHYEGHVDVFHEGQLVASLPFGFISLPPAITDVRLARPVISLGDDAYRGGARGASSTLEVSYYAHLGHALETWVFKNIPGVTCEMTHENWMEERFHEAFVGFGISEGGASENAIVGGRRERMGIFDGRVLPKGFQWEDSAGRHELLPGNRPPANAPRTFVELEEGDYIIMLQVGRQVGVLNLIFIAIPLYSTEFDDDVLLHFSVDNTPPVLEAETEIDEDTGILTVSGNIHDEWFAKAMEDERFNRNELWLPGSPFGPEIAVENNLAVWMQVGDIYRRATVDEYGNFSEEFADVTAPIAVTLWGLDNYTLVSQVTTVLNDDAFIRQPFRGHFVPPHIFGFHQDGYFRNQNTPEGDNPHDEYLRLAHLAGYVVNPIFDFHVWNGTNVTELRLGIGEAQLSFNLGGTSAHPTEPASIDPIRVVPGTLILNAPGFPENPTRLRHRFDGWAIGEHVLSAVAPLQDHDAPEADRDPNRMPSENLTIHAQWIPLLQLWFDINAPLPEVTPPFIFPLDLYPGDVIMAHPDFPANPTRAGYEFGGWRLDGEPITGTTVMPNVTVTLTAHWIPYVQVRFDMNAAGTEPNQIAPIMVLQGTPIMSAPDWPADPSRPGTNYMFGGWMFDLYTAVQDFIRDNVPPELLPMIPAPGQPIPPMLRPMLPEWFPDTMPIEGEMFPIHPEIPMPDFPVTLVASWLHAYHLTFVSEVEIPSIMVIEQTPIMSAVGFPASPVRDGYTFGGWFMDAERTVRLAPGELMPSEDIQIYDSWVIPEDGVAWVTNHAQLLSAAQNNNIHTIYVLNNIVTTANINIAATRTNPVTISPAPGIQGRTEISAGASFAVFTVAGNATNRANVTFRDLDITRVNNVAGPLNRALTLSGTATLENVRIFGHNLSSGVGTAVQAQGSVAGGGHTAQLTIRDSELFNNTSDFIDLGGLQLGGAGTIGLGIAGPAILEVYSTHIHNNFAGVNGGGIFANSGTGAWGHKINVHDSHIYNNIGGMSGGGIHIAGTSTVYATELHLHNTYIYNNTAMLAWGAGVFVQQSNNHVYMRGGAIFNNHNFGTSVDADGNITTDQYNGGGGVAISGGGASFTMFSGSIHGNTAESGAGVFIHGSGSRFIMHDGEIYNNTAQIHGGGVDVMFRGPAPAHYTALEIFGGRIHGNTAPRGGGVNVRGRIYYEAAENAITGNSPAQIMSSDPRATFTNISAMDFNTGGTLTSPTIPANWERVWVPHRDDVMEHLPDWSLERPGYHFMGWYMDEEFTIPLTPGTIMPFEPITIHARWLDELPSEFEVSFELNADLPPIEPIMVFEHALILANPLFPADPEREGYDFRGWYFDEELEVLLSATDRMPGEDITLYAGWEVIPPCDDCGENPCECEELCEDCGKHPCECEDLCEDCGKHPCECEELCEDCGKHPCECEELCEDCGKHPCECEELCEDCGKNPCECEDLCEDCGKYPCECEDLCEDCGKNPCECEELCEDCGKNPCECEELCEDCGKNPCECEELCEDCGKYPCECEELCEDCGKNPCECEELCEDCGKNPCECEDLCEDCGKYPCECEELCEDCGKHPCECDPVTPPCSTCGNHPCTCDRETPSPEPEPNFPGPPTLQPTPPTTDDEDDEDEKDEDDIDEPDVPLAPLPSFIDVGIQHWAHDYVQSIAIRGIMQGVSANIFEPETTLNRAMAATILWRLAGEPSTEFIPTFTDVRAGEWYSEAITWGSEIGILLGVGDDLFNPSGELTREQFAALMFRFAQYMELETDVPETHTLSIFTDYDDVSEWAIEYMLWAHYVGLISGVDEQTLLPDGTATRAQTATILYRFITIMEQSEDFHSDDEANLVEDDPNNS